MSSRWVDFKVLTTSFQNPCSSHFSSCHIDCLACSQVNSTYTVERRIVIKVPKCSRNLERPHPEEEEWCPFLVVCINKETCTQSLQISYVIRLHLHHVPAPKPVTGKDNEVTATGVVVSHE